MYELFSRISTFPHDKAMHLIGGMVIFAVLHISVGSTLGMAVVCLVAISKEFADWYTGKGTPDVWDFAVMLAGGAVGYICTL